jgi:hypothetical protein
MYPEDAVMDDPTKRPLADPVMTARFKKFPEGGAERQLLEDWLSGSSKAARTWVIKVNASKNMLQVTDTMNLLSTARDIHNFKSLLGTDDDIRKTFSSQGVEPEVLKTLFGDPIDYDVKPCPDDSLTDLLRRSHIDILIGMCYLCTHSTVLDPLNSSDITAAAEVVYDGYETISPSQSLTK